MDLPITPSSGFHFFRSLPPELRLKIWHLTFHSRVLEFHPRSSDSYNPDNHDVPITWQSDCANHPALLTSSESRTEALTRYPVGVPVSTTAGGQQRILYLDPELDMVAILGRPGDQTAELLYDIQRRDPLRRQPRRVAVGFHAWTNLQSNLSANGCARLLLKGQMRGTLDRVVLLMYAQGRPPAGFENGECVLEPARGFEMTPHCFLGKYDRFEDGWCIYGKLWVRVMNLGFVGGKKAGDATTSH